MICISRRRWRISLPPRPVSPPRCNKSRPSKKMDPDVGSISRRIRRPSVLLPEPDSPIRPSVSPFGCRTRYRRPRALRHETFRRKVTRRARKLSSDRGFRAEARCDAIAPGHGFTRILADRTYPDTRGHQKKSVLIRENPWLTRGYRGTAASAANSPTNFQRLKCSFSISHARSTVTAGYSDVITTASSSRPCWLA